MPEMLFYWHAERKENAQTIYLMFISVLFIIVFYIEAHQKDWRKVSQP